MCIPGVIFWNLFYLIKHQFKKILGTVTTLLLLESSCRVSSCWVHRCCWNIPLILTSSMHLGRYRHECVCVCSQQASQPWARSKVRWGGRELWEMKPSWTWISFAHNGANRSSDTWACLRDSQGTNWKKILLFSFFDMWLSINLPSLSLFLLGIVSLSHSLLNDINWQEAEFSGWSQPFLQRTSYCFKYPWMDSASVCTKSMDRC